MAELTPEAIAAIVAQVIAAQAPAQSAPVAPVAASPFAVLQSPKASRERDLPASVLAAMNGAVDGERQKVGRLAAAYYAEPRFACSAKTRTLAGPEGPREGGHGFVFPRESGTACPTAECEGTIL